MTIDWDRIKRLAGSDYSPLTRSDYEQMAERAGVETMTDAHLLTSYGVEFGDFTMSHYDDDTRIRMKLARRRQFAVRNEAREQRAAAPAVEMVICSRCRRETPRNQMMTSTMDGAMCPDCWHEVSDGDGYGL